jgi:hypothetical protein
MLPLKRGGLAKLGLAIVPTVALAFGTLCAPAAAASNTANVSVAVTAGVQATIGVTYSTGSNISCNVGTAISGFVACTNTATLAGTFRSSKTDTGGTSVAITAAAITGTGTGVIPATAWEMSCTGGVTGSPANAGTAGTLASNTALSTSAVACQSWTGEIIANYSLVVALSLDAAQVPADTYAASNFTATATAN